MFFRLIFIIIDAINYIQSPFSWRCNNDFFYTLIKISLQAFWLFVMFASRFNNNIATRPVGFSNACIGRISDSLSRYIHLIRISAYILLPGTMYRIKFKQMCRACCIRRDFINLHDVVFIMHPACAKTKTPHASKTIDSNFYLHY